ncbi:MAG TPA: transglutaminase-like domain-containing protein [Gemmataceae bacterium]|nr:transglutaminase-like domain-containing protein [Gemmataceae bacterium]
MDLDQALDQLAQDAAAPLDVAELALWLARDEYANVDVEAYLSELTGMAHEVKRYLRGSLEARVFGLCRYLFHEMGFRGNIQDYYDPRNSYLNEVLDRRTGLPITLSLVAMAVGQRAGLQIAGIGLPGHFVAMAKADGQEVLFDPFHGGRQLTPADCETLVQQVTGMPFQATPEQLEPVPLRLLVLRLLTNLKGVYLQQKDFLRAARVIERLRQLSPEDILQRRDLGVSLVHAGQPGRAIDHLAAYLSITPGSTDNDAVRQLLNQALKAVGRWN